ncbi:hypothetical protein L7F22_052113 [Adiantum nelumboides]|nr:hypothetical protein [Adiantum nelumboides]
MPSTHPLTLWRRCPNSKPLHVHNKLVMLWLIKTSRPWVKPIAASDALVQATCKAPRGATNPAVRHAPVVFNAAPILPCAQAIDVASLPSGHAILVVQFAYAQPAHAGATHVHHLALDDAGAALHAFQGSFTLVRWLLPKQALHPSGAAQPACFALSVPNPVVGEVVGIPPSSQWTVPHLNAAEALQHDGNTSVFNTVEPL